MENIFSLDLPEEWEKVREPDTGDGEQVFFVYKYSLRHSISIWYHPDYGYTLFVGGTSSLDSRDPIVIIDDIKKWIPIVEDDYLYISIENMLGADGRPFKYISGIGSKKIKKLMTKFKSADDLKNASIQEISEVRGIGWDTAWHIAGYFHDNIRIGELWDPVEKEWVKIYQIPDEIVDSYVKRHRRMTSAEREKYRMLKKEIKKRGLLYDK